MAMGPIQFAGIVGFRSVAPVVYANPFNGGVVSWIGDPSNDWDIVAYVLVAVVLCSAVWLINGAVAFFETRSIVAAGTCVAFVWLMVVLAQGEKYDPLDWRETTTVMLFGLALLSAGGRAFGSTEDQKDKKK